MPKIQQVSDSNDEISEDSPDNDSVVDSKSQDKSDLKSEEPSGSKKSQTFLEKMHSALETAYTYWSLIIWPLLRKALEIASLGAAAVTAVFLERNVGGMLLRPFFKVFATTGFLWTMGPIIGVFAFTTFLRSTLSHYKDFRPQWDEIAWISNGLAYFTAVNLLHFGLIEASYSYATALSSTFLLTTSWVLIYENFDLLTQAVKAIAAKISDSWLFGGKDADQSNNKPAKQVTPPQKSPRSSVEEKISAQEEPSALSHESPSVSDDVPKLLTVARDALRNKASKQDLTEHEHSADKPRRGKRLANK